MLSRRGLIFGGAALIVAAPSIVRAASLMDIRGALYVAYHGPQTETWTIRGINQHGRKVIEEIPALRYSQTKFKLITSVWGRPPSRYPYLADYEWPAWHSGITEANESRDAHGAIEAGINPDAVPWPDLQEAFLREGTTAPRQTVRATA